MKIRLLSLLLVLLPLSAAYSGTPSPTAIDTLYYDSLNKILVRGSVLYSITVSTTPDTITLPVQCRYINIVPWGATTDTLQLSVAQGSVPKYSEWIRGDGAVFRDYEKSYLNKIYVKGKSTSFTIWLRAY